MGTLFNQFNEAYCKFYNPSKYITVDEIIVPFKERVIFKQKQCNALTSQLLDLARKIYNLGAG
jgi:hypothetical protein